MRATLIRAGTALCAGRPSHEVAIRLGAAFGMAAALWASACAFLMLEPEATGAKDRRQAVASTPAVSRCPDGCRLASYGLLGPLKSASGTGPTVVIGGVRP